MIFQKGYSEESRRRNFGVSLEASLEHLEKLYFYNVFVWRQGKICWDYCLSHWLIRGEVYLGSVALINESITVPWWRMLETSPRFSPMSGEASIGTKIIRMWYCWHSNPDTPAPKSGRPGSIHVKIIDYISPKYGSTVRGTTTSPQLVWRNVARTSFAPSVAMLKQQMCVTATMTSRHWVRSCQRTLQSSPWVTVLLSYRNARLLTLPQIG
jgi:hypothetical protein